MTNNVDGVRKKSGLLSVISMIIVAIAIGAAIYYLQITRNEASQNKLHFQALKQIGIELDNAFLQLDAFAGSRLGQAISSCEKFPCDGSSDESINNENDETLYSNVLKNVFFDKTLSINEKLNVDNFDTKFEFVRLKQQYGLEHNNVYITVTKGPIKFTIPVENLLSGNHQQFPKVLVANYQGEVLGVKENFVEGSYQSALEFSSVSNILRTVYGSSDLSKQKKDTSSSANNNNGDAGKAESNVQQPKVPGFSGFSEVDIGGNKYRVYVSPYRIKHQEIVDKTSKSSREASESNQYFLLGIKPSGDISLAKMSISPSIGLILIVLLLALVGLVPILKVRFVSPNYAFTRSDIWSLSIGLAVLVGLITVSYVDYTFYAQLKRQIHIEERHSFDLLKTQFLAEVTDIKQQAVGIDWNNSDQLNGENKNKNGTINLVGMEDTSYSIEEIFQIKKDGWTEESGWRVSQNNETRYQDRVLDLKFREYFQSAILCKAWQLQATSESRSDANCQDQVYIQRILNLSDGRRTTQFSFPAFNEGSAASVGRADYVISAGTMLQTFFEPVLPQNYKFAVFENKTGKVLYHSNDELSLIENFYIATDNNQALHSIVKQIGFYPQPNHFVGKYKGTNHEFVAGPMISGLPWTLVVFFDKQELQSFNFLLVSTSLIFFLLFTLVLALLISVSIDYFPWRTGILFLRKNQKKFTVLFSFLLLLSAAELMSFLVITDLITRFGIWLLGLSGFLLLMSLTLAKTSNIHFVFSRMFNLIIVLAALSLIVIISADHTGQIIELFSQHNNITLVILLLLVAICSSVWLHFKLDSPINVTTSAKYQKRYTFYVIALLIYLAGVPALSVTNSAFWFFINKAAEIQTLHVNSAIHNGSEIRHAYHRSIGVAKSPEKIRPLTFFSPQDPDQISAQKSDDMTSHQHPWVTKLNSLDEDPSNILEEHPKSSRLLAHIFRNSNVDLSLPAMLSVLLQNDEVGANSRFKKGVVLPLWSVTVSPENIIATGILNTFWNYLMGALLVFGILFITIRHLLLSRLMGADISGLYHNFGRAEPSQFDDFKCSLVHKPKHEPAFYMLLRPTRNNFNKMIKEVKDRQALGKVLDLQEALIEYSDNENNLEKDNKDAVKQQRFINYISKIHKELSESRDSKDIIVITKLNSIMFNSCQRKNALALLELIARFGHLKIVLVTDVSPLYRLIKQSAFPAITDEQLASSEEKLRWSNLFSRFEKYYDWHPHQPSPDEFPANLYNLLKRECNSWPELLKLEHTFVQYHVMHKLKAHIDERLRAEYSDEKATEGLLKAENLIYQLSVEKLNNLNLSEVQALKTDTKLSDIFSFSVLEGVFKGCGGLNASLRRHWNENELFEFFSEKAGGVYRYRWEICTKQERMLLYQIARGRIVNPHNHDALEHLVRRGYILNRGLWTINCSGFKQFILSAESKKTFKDWMREYGDSNWQFIRIPIFVTITILFGVILYSATEAYETILGLMTASLGLVPLFLKNIASFRGDHNSPNND